MRELKKTNDSAKRQDQQTTRQVVEGGREREAEKSIVCEHFFFEFHHVCLVPASQRASMLIRIVQTNGRASLSFA